MSAEATTTIHIAAPPERVWPWVADIARHPEWSPRPYRVELVSGEPNTVGTTYRSTGFVPPNEPDHANDVTIIDVVPMRRFALDARDESGVFRNVFTLRPSGSGTDVSFHIAFPKMRGLSAIMVPILFPIFAKADFRKRMQLLKAAVEAAA